MDVRDGFIEAVGQTPLIVLRKASEVTGCTILGKAEFLNPGGSVKDRAAKYIVLDAEERGELQPGGLIVEGTAGNTGIGLALVGNARGYRTVIVIPETQSQEKKDMLRLCGAELREVPAVPFKDPTNYVHVAEQHGLFFEFLGSEGRRDHDEIRIARHLIVVEEQARPRKGYIGDHRQTDEQSSRYGGCGVGLLRQ